MDTFQHSLFCSSFPAFLYSSGAVVPKTSVRFSLMIPRACFLTSNWSIKRTSVTKRALMVMSLGSEADDEKNDTSDGKGRDWDSSWSNYQQKKSGGVFQLPDQKTETKERDVIDERTERLTSIWTNENGFLLAIGGILLIAAFYSYIYATGGINR